MKGNIALVVIAFVLNEITLASSYQNGGMAHTHVMSHVQKSMRSFPIMMRGNTVHLECFNGFLPLINSLATKARDVSSGCVSVAIFEKDQELENLKNARLAFAVDVDKITKSLTDCSKKFGLDYFQCLEDNAEVNRNLMEKIKNKSLDLMTKYNKKSEQIDRQQLECIMRAVNNAKAESDQAFIDLKSCIKDGPIIQTQ